MRRILCVASTLVLAACTPFRAAESPYNLGVAAWKQKDYPEAARQWSVEVLQGNADALNNLAYLYFNGLGGPKRVDAAVGLWRLAAQAGHSEAQWHLGFAYERGAGVPQSPSRAFGWYRCAMASAEREAHGDKEAIERTIFEDAKRSLEDLQPGMSAAEIAEGEALARELIDRYGRAAPWQAVPSPGDQASGQ
ncbi:MAG: sel1 repeat family protein [Proteobacteria bacterium]|nr:sel1 repeat family protein [Pseudomonadota bacterium]